MLRTFKTFALKIHYTFNNSVPNSLYAYVCQVIDGCRGHMTMRQWPLATLAS